MFETELSQLFILSVILNIGKHFLTNEKKNLPVLDLRRRPITEVGQNIQI